MLALGGRRHGVQHRTAYLSGGELQRDVREDGVLFFAHSVSLPFKLLPQRVLRPP